MRFRGFVRRNSPLLCACVFRHSNDHAQCYPIGFAFVFANRDANCYAIRVGYANSECVRDSICDVDAERLADSERLGDDERVEYFK